MSNTIHIDDGSSSPMTQTLANRSIFPQQGSVEWVGLLSSIVQVSVGVLSRYAAGGVDTYTAIAAQALCNNFKLAPLGQRHLQEALNRLSSFRSLGDVFWFGFGVKHLVRSLVATEQGASCLALCGALSECYHGSVPAEMMADMVRHSHAPDELRPSVLQWDALIKACAGIFSCTQFPTRVEFFMTLSPNYPARPGTDWQCSEPESVAEALWAIGQVSRGELASITVVGRSEAAAYLAAIAEWFFDLSLEVRDESAVLLYCTPKHQAECAQLSIVLQRQLQTQPPSSGPSNTPLSLQTIGKTYVLRDCEELLRYDGYGGYDIYRPGRVNWKNVLSSVFGSDYSKLLSVSRAFGLALGNAARIFKGIVNLEEGIPPEISAFNNTFCDSSYGGGFIENLVHWFPELQELRMYLEEGLKVSYDHAKTMYEANLSQVASVCACTLCLSTLAQRKDKEETEDDCFEYDDDRYCCIVLVDTIIDVARCLSVIEIPENLYPTRNGFELCYNRHLNNRLERSKYKHHLTSIGPVLFSIGMMGSDGDRGCTTETQSSFRILELFTGRSLDSVDVGYASAICQAGLCAHLNILRELSDSDQDLGRLTITPGRIEFKAKTYDYIGDSTSRSAMREDGIGQPIQIGKKLDMILSASFDELSIIAKEGADKLLIWFALKGSTSSSADIMRVSPRYLMDSLRGSRGRVHCKRRKCRVLQNVTPSDISPVHQKLHIYGKDIDIFRGPRLSRFALFGSKAILGVGTLLFVDQECICCSVNSVLQHDDRLSEQEGSRRMVIVIAAGTRNRY